MYWTKLVTLEPLHYMQYRDYVSLSYVEGCL